MPPRRPATIVDVAEAAGVSRQTVTRAMNDMPGISASTKERVLAAAQALAYRPSRYGRGLVGHRQPTIGLVVDDLTNPYYPQLASAVVASATARGWNVVLAQTAGAADEQALITDLAVQTDAMIGYLRLLQGASAGPPGVPFVRIDAAEQAGSGTVELDVAPAMADLADHLLARGARHPAMLDGGLPGTLSARASRFREAMEARGVDVARLACGSTSFAAGTTGTEALLAAHPEVDAIVAFNDMMACGALTALHRAGIDVPRQVRLAGCDGLDLGAFVYPALTTLAVDMVQVADAAVGMAVRMTEAPGTRAGHARVAHRLTVRDST